MNNELVVKQGQSFLDKVTQLTGRLEDAFEMGIANNVVITDPIAIGSEVKATPVTNKRVVTFYNSFNEPGTELTEEHLTNASLLEGIDYWGIEYSFIVQ